MGQCSTKNHPKSCLRFNIYPPTTLVDIGNSSPGAVMMSVSESIGKRNEGRALSNFARKWWDGRPQILT